MACEEMKDFLQINSICLELFQIIAWNVKKKFFTPERMIGSIFFSFECL